MAKKKTTFSFADMQKTMGVISKKAGILIDTDITERTYINTDIYMLNALLSKSIYGGVSDNRMTVFAGPEAVGKSYLCYNIARNAQKTGKNVIYIDTEFSIELSELTDFGIDVSPEKFMLIRSNKVEDIKFMMSQFLDTLKQEKIAGNEIAETIVFLDSIGQLASNKEVNDAIDGKNKVDMSRAKAIKSLFRIINADLGYLNIPLICTNHTYKCFTKDTEVLMSNNSYKNINNINIGEYVKTLDGDKIVENVVDFENSTVMEIILDDGEIMKCTKNHKFLVNENWSEDENDSCWISAEDLTDSHFILAVSE